MISPKGALIFLAALASAVASFLIFKPLSVADTVTSTLNLPLTLTQPKLSRYCFQAVREEFKDWETPYYKEFEEQRNICINQLLAEQGYLKAHEALEKAPQPVHDYRTLAKNLMALAEKNDLPTLSKLSLSAKEIPMKEYLAEFYKSRRIKPIDTSPFQVRFFDWDTAPMPASSFARWLDDNTVIYSATLYPGTNGPKSSIVSLNITSLHRELDLPEASLEQARPPQLTRRYDGCQELGAGAVACRKILEPAHEIAREDGGAERICAKVDPQVAVFKTPHGEFEYDFKWPVNIDFRYDAFSEEYWITADTRVWRFTKDLKPMGEENYSKGVWGNVICASSGGARICRPAQQTLDPCDIFKHSTKAGFLVQGSTTIYDRDNLDAALMHAKGLFLVMKDDSAIEILPEFDNHLPHITISPDGCKAAFIHYQKPQPKNLSGGYTGDTINYMRGAQLGIIELCKSAP